MINAPQVVLDALESGNVSYANLVTVNLGDAYDTGTDVILHLTDYGHVISFGGNNYTPDNNLVELTGISRKASTGSDAVDIVFGVTNSNIIDVIRSERYINQPTSIDRVVMEDGAVVGDFAIPIRTAWGIAHSISGDIDDRLITLSIDSSLGDLDGDNGWYAINASHHQRYPDDDIMKHSSTVMTEEQKKKYTTNFSGVINSQVKPPSLSKIYGYRNVELVPICMLKHRKTHTSYRHYFTTMIYAVSIGDCDFIDIKNLKKDDEKFSFSHNTSPSTSGGGWSVLERSPEENEVPVRSDPKLGFWIQRMDAGELDRLNGMYGKGLTLLFVNNRNRDDWLSSMPKLTLPVRGASVYDPRTGLSAYSRNPALQYADYLRSVEYGAGKRGIPVLDSNITELANHFDQIPDSIGNAGINSILIDVQVDTGEPLVDNMNIWMEGTRLYTSDYYGTFNVRVETKAATNWVLDEDDLIDYPEFESGDFTDRINQLTYTIKQLVPDETDGAELDDLVEVDVEATFPADGSQMHIDWLSEDGDIHNFESEQLSYVTELEQAFYWAMVDSRIARQPRKLTLPVGVKGWLSEVGDVIDFSSAVMDMTNTLWRVDEVSEEDEGKIELTLVAYSNEFYTPEPNIIPAPVSLAQPPTGVSLSPVAGLSIIEKSGLHYLDWTPLSSENVSWYAVEIIKDAATFIDEPKVAQPPLLLESLTVGDYDVTVTAIGINTEGEDAVLSFTIELPVAPTFNINAETFEVEIALSTTSNLLGVNFELKINTVDDEATALSKGTGSTFTILTLAPLTTYYVFAKTINIAGESVWSSANFTTEDGQKYVDVVGELPLVDVAKIQAELDTIPRAWGSIVEDISLIFDDAIGGKDNIVNTKAIETESATRQSEVQSVNSELNTLNTVTIPNLQSDLNQIDSRFPITSVNISNNSISSPKILANAITAIKIIAGAISADKIAANAVSADKIVSNAVIADKIAANAITAAKISSSAITTDKIAALAIVADKIAVNAIIASKIAAGAITADKIAALTITADKIAANTIDADQIKSNIIFGTNAVFQGTVYAENLEGDVVDTIVKTTIERTWDGSGDPPRIAEICSVTIAPMPFDRIITCGRISYDKIGSQSPVVDFGGIVTARATTYHVPTGSTRVAFTLTPPTATILANASGVMTISVGEEFTFDQYFHTPPQDLLISIFKQGGTLS